LEDPIEQGRSHPKQRRFKVTVHHLPCLKRRKPVCEEEKKNYTNAHWPGPIIFRPELEGLQSASSGQTFLHRHEVQDNREYRHQQSNSGRTVGVPIRPNKRQRRTHEIKKKRKGGRERTNETKTKRSRKQGRIKKKTRGRERERSGETENRKNKKSQRAKRGTKNRSFIQLAA